MKIKIPLIKLWKRDCKKSHAHFVTSNEFKFIPLISHQNLFKNIQKNEFTFELTLNNELM